MSNDKMRSEAYIVFCEDKNKAGWDARNFFDAGWQAALSQSEPASDLHHACNLWIDPMSASYVVDHCDHPPSECIPAFVMRTTHTVNIAPSKPVQVSQPVAYEVSTKDEDELVYAIYYTKYKNQLPEGAKPLFLAPPDYEALRTENEALRKQLSHAEQAATVEAKIADEFRAERDVLRQRVTELLADSAKMKAECLKYVEEIEAALKKAKR
jgi:hypothetical protein